ncbi:MAG TPA: glycosyltransferase [Candidatus Omnitrophota bacterium]|nr:glycosyltransferase [Candidatus Omnitrophota bacterium]HRZ14801.1 glycosyltransferase [Candidatus Omnitrophota bacterium]
MLKKKNVVLMYISEVSGHHSATLAIEKALHTLSSNIETLNINAFRYTNPISEKVVNQIYTTVIKRTPMIWDLIYDNPTVKERLEKIKDAIHKMNSKKFQRLFGKFHPDAVICTQAFPCGMVADYKKMYNAHFPLIAVLTDYVPHSYWIYDNVDFYVVPSEEIGHRLMLKGVPPEKIKPLGIPFDFKFNAPVDRHKVYASLGLDPRVPTMLLMGGGQGLGPIKSIVKALEKVEMDFQEIIVCGVNKKLYSSLQKKIKKYGKKIVLLKYVDNINELMTISQLIVTKPGGITTSEALSKKLPMLIIKPIPGQEASNTVYLTEKNAAIKIDHPRHIDLVVQDLFEHPHKISQLSECAGALSKPNASMDIAKLILEVA